MKTKSDQILNFFLTRFKFENLVWVAAVVGFFATGLLIYEYRSWQNVFQTHVGMIYNITQAREDVAEAQIRLQEISAGIRANKTEDVVTLFEQAEQLIDISISGKGGASFLVGSPLTDDPELLLKLEQMKTAITRLKGTVKYFMKTQKKARLRATK